MTALDEFDRLLTTWLEDAATASRPGYLEETLEAIARLPQRSARRAARRWLVLPAFVRRAGAHPLVPLVLLALLLAVVLGALAVAGARRPSPPPFGLAATGWLVYDADGDILLARPDGTGIRPLVASPSLEHGATFSRDGTRVAYWTTRVGRPAELWQVDTGGSEAVLLSGGLAISADAHAPAGSWSPDGSRLAFSSATGELYVVATDGQSAPRRIGDESRSRFAPAWSPDGAWIAFRGEPVGPDPGAAVYVIRPDGTDETRVSRVSGGRVPTMLQPGWSPDGRSLLYAAVYGAPPGIDGVGQVTLATSEGSGWSERAVAQGARGWLPRFSTDGSRIAFLRARDPAAGGRDLDRVGADVHEVGLDGNGIRKVSDVPMRAAPPCWLPDDRGVAGLTGEPGRPAEYDRGARYVVLPLAPGLARVEIPAPGIQGSLACSWQRVAR